MRLLLAPILALSVAGQATDIYDQAPTTVLGCKCTSPCTTSIWKRCNTAPYCTIEDQNCVNGYSSTAYDYCVYKPFQSYEQLPAKQKKDIVMAHVNKDTTPSKYPSQIGVLTGIMGESVMVSFDSSSDVFPPAAEKRKKYIHGVGVTGGISFDSLGNHEYTGLFKGAKHGIIRLSSAKEPGSGGITPGMGIKFFRDGRPSANFVAMYSLDGQPCTDKNFFAHDWANHISTTSNFGLKLIAAKFWQASYCPLMVGLSDLSSTGDSSSPEFPFKLSFKSLAPTDCPCDDYAKCMSNLASIPVNSKLFEVWAHAEPDDAKGSLIGHITLTDKLTTSKFGDEELFFKHQHMENDWKLRPEWLEKIDKKEECGMSVASADVPPISKGCTSPFHGMVTSMLDSDHPNVTLV